ncbi:MAG: cytidine deaminase [Blautia sp.]|nr:cytidine deaminase [Blautia sp.]
MTDYKKLIRKAFEAREKAYVPYSGFRVGAALLTSDGEIYGGCNIENASYGATNCAERTAFFRALYDGKRDFEAIAITGGKKDGPDREAWPCGICRQVMAEFCDMDRFEVIIAVSEEDYIVCKLREILPHAFSPESLK